MTQLAEKIAKSRLLKIKVEEMTFLARRMTAVEYAKVQAGKVSDFDVVTTFGLVIGWENVKEKDLIPDGEDKSIDFNGSDFDEWVVDRLDVLTEIITQVAQNTTAFLTKKDENEKNSSAGTTKASASKK